MRLGRGRYNFNLVEYCTVLILIEMCFVSEWSTVDNCSKPVLAGVIEANYRQDFREDASQKGRNIQV